MQSQIKINERGFSLRGGDENGQCYFVKNIGEGDSAKTIKSEVPFILDLVKAETVDEDLYYDDPVLTF